jgi:hypothetical protein
MSRKEVANMRERHLPALEHPEDDASKEPGGACMSSSFLPLLC